MSNTKKAILPAVELDIPLPDGGRARFYDRNELTPRRTRRLDVMLAHLGPRIREITAAQQLTAANGDTDISQVFGGPAVHLTEEEAAKFADLNDLGAWVYCKEIRDSAGRTVPLPDDPDGMQDMPTPIYEAIVGHAGKLIAGAALASAGFSVDDLPDDLDQADPDLPTSA